MLAIPRPSFQLLGINNGALLPPSFTCCYSQCGECRHAWCLQIRGQNFAQQAWQAGVHLINGHHSTLSNLHIIGQTGWEASLEGWPVTTLVQNRISMKLESD